MDKPYYIPLTHHSQFPHTQPVHLQKSGSRIFNGGGGGGLSIPFFFFFWFTKKCPDQSVEGGGGGAPIAPLFFPLSQSQAGFHLTTAGAL